MDFYADAPMGSTDCCVNITSTTVQVSRAPMAHVVLIRLVDSLVTAQLGGQVHSVPCTYVTRHRILCVATETAGVMRVRWDTRALAEMDGEVRIASSSLTLANGQPLCSVVHMVVAVAEVAPVLMGILARIASGHPTCVCGQPQLTVSIRISELLFHHHQVVLQID